MSRKVVVTGLGAITPIGENVQETWQNALKGVSGVHALEQDWVSEYGLAVRIGATAPRPSEAAVSKVQAKRLDPSGQLSVAAAREAFGSREEQLRASTLAELVSALTASADPQASTVLSRSSFLINSVAATDRDHPLREGDTVDVLPPFAGG